MADGLSVTPWQSSCANPWDFTCFRMFVPTHSTLAVTEASLVDNRRENRKERLYHRLESAHVLILVAIETVGVFGACWSPHIIQIH